VRESLDELLGRLLADQPELVDEVREITVDGMEGRIPFHESLARRLDLARPRRTQVEALGLEAVRWITPGLEPLIRGLAADAWLVSGGLAEALLPVAAHLGIPAERVLATRVRWSPLGEMLGVECRGKSDLIRPHRDAFARPSVLVGDGMTDYEPFRDGLVDHFVAFTANVRREPVVATGAPVADSVAGLEQVLGRIL